MALPDDEIEQLHDILATNRKNAYNSEEASTTRFLEEVTTHEKAVVPRGAAGSHRSFHAHAEGGRPACGGGPRTKNGYRVTSKEEAIRWYAKCRFCYRHIDPLRGLPDDTDVTLADD